MLGRAVSRCEQRLALIVSALGRARPGGRGSRRSAARAMRLTVALAVASTALFALSTAAQSVGVPVEIDSFGNAALPTSPFTRTVTQLPAPGTTMGTPQGTFSQSGGVGTMEMSGAGNGTSGITLVYTPTAGGSVDLTGGGTNAQIFIDFALIDQVRAAGDTSVPGVTTYMTAYDAEGDSAISPSDAVGNLFAFNAAFPFTGFKNVVGTISWTHITELDVTFVYPDDEHGRRLVGGAGQPALGDARKRLATGSAEPDGDGGVDRDRHLYHGRRLHRVVRERRERGTRHLRPSLRHRRAGAGSPGQRNGVRDRDAERHGQWRTVHIHGRRLRHDPVGWDHGGCSRGDRRRRLVAVERRELERPHRRVHLRRPMLRGHLLDERHRAVYEHAGWDLHPRYGCDGAGQRVSGGYLFVGGCFVVYEHAGWDLHPRYGCVRARCARVRRVPIRRRVLRRVRARRLGPTSPARVRPGPVPRVRRAPIRRRVLRRVRARRLGPTSPARVRRGRGVRVRRVPTRRRVLRRVRARRLGPTSPARVRRGRGARVRRVPIRRRVLRRARTRRPAPTSGVRVRPGPAAHVRRAPTRRPRVPPRARRPRPAPSS